MRWTIGKKLGFGFAAMIAITGTVAAIVYFKVNTVNVVQKRVMDGRQPTVQATMGVLNGVNDSLASLRGYMILGKDKFVAGRAASWQSIDKHIASLDELSQDWTNSENAERLKELKQVLGEFQTVQKSVEDICQTDENIPATKILIEQAAPLAKILGENITKMIDAEAQYDTTSILNASQKATGAIQLAEVAAKQIVTARSYYTKNVIGKLKKEDPDFKANENYHDIEGAIPLPATFVRETSESLDKTANYRYDLISKWSINKEKGLSNDYDKRAWDALSSDSKTPYAEFTSGASGVEYRYATADLANVEGCVSCHNNHQDSPKKDFQVGDLMGILVVSTHVTQDPKIGEILLDLGRADGGESSVSEAAQKLLDDIIKRKDLLGMMADTRGTLGLGLGAIRGYLVSGDENFKEQFKTLWAKNTKRFGDLSENIDLLTPEQHKAYELFAKTRQQLEPLSSKMFSIRGSQDWNVANKMLGTEAAPRAARCKEILAAMLKDQQSMMVADAGILASQSSSLQTTVIVAAVVGTIVGIFLGWIIVRLIVRPITAMVAMVRDIAEGEGDLTKRLNASGTDELAVLAQWFNTFLEKLHDIIANLTGNGDSLATASSEMSATATQLASGAEETTNQSNSVAAAAEQMSTNMNNVSASTEELSTNTKTIAAAVEEMTASISEVAGNASRAADVAGNASKLAESSNSKLSELGDAADKIGSVIEVIQDIAEQTNLLALNATIESARAGDAGKGFAVVATEVKELARQTATATDDIRGRIQGIQESSGEAVDSITEIGEAIENVNQASQSIAAAVEQQSCTTKEIAKNVTQTATASDLVTTGIAEAAQASSEISRNIVGVNQAASEAATGAAQTQTASDELNRLAQSIRKTLGQFKTTANDEGSEKPATVGDDKPSRMADGEVHAQEVCLAGQADV